MMTEVCSARFPHSEIAGSQDICSSPTLIAAYHVFRRLSVPRHPPCALCSMTTSMYSVTLMGRSFLWLKNVFVNFVCSVFLRASLPFPRKLSAFSVAECLLCLLRSACSRASSCHPFFAVALSKTSRKFDYLRFDVLSFSICSFQGTCSFGFKRLNPKCITRIELVLCIPVRIMHDLYHLPLQFFSIKRHPPTLPYRLQ